MTVYVYTWGNNPRRAELKGRRCVIEAKGKMGTILVRFLDTNERVTTSHYAVRPAPKPEVLIGQVCRTGVQTVEREGDRYFVTIKNRTYYSRVEVPIEAARKHYRAMRDSGGMVPC